MGWRVWLAFEVRPGITAAFTADRSIWRGLVESRRGADGKIDSAEFARWLDVLTDRVYLWASA